MMKVIAGRFKGLKLQMPKGTKIRPSAQRLKAALFNILGKKIEGASFLELFAGSGSIGIEALSRGAASVTFVENNRFCLKTIEANLRHLDLGYSYRLEGRSAQKAVFATLVTLDAERAIDKLHQARYRFDFVFLDPPYYQDQLKNCLIKLEACDILKPHSWVIAEHHRKEIMAGSFADLTLMLAKRYGDTLLSFYQMKPRLTERKRT